MVKRKSIHFVLSKSKDADILAWKNSLEDGSFNRLVNEILIAESEKKIANIPCGSKKVDELQTINSRLLVYDRYAIELIESFGPKEVTSSIKKIIRKHLNKNRQAVNHSKDDRYKLIGDILKAFEVKMIEKAQEYSGVSNKYQKLCDAYDMAINNLFIELLSCASSPSMNEACNKIRNFNCTEIINNAYKVAFEVPQAENENKKKTIAPSLEETKPKVVNNEQKVVSVSDEPTKEPQKKILTEPINENVEKNPPANNFYERIRAMTESNKPKLTTEIKKNDSINYEYEDEYYDEDWDE
ncbi:MAG: hypothetical protein IJN93_07665 [Clostridia bacterium]|nr:hypothetical protein [Clostridia bacterium]